MTGRMRVLGKEGDIVLQWDADDESTWEQAEKDFNAMIEAGFTAYVVPDLGGKRKKLTEFTPAAGGDIVFAPAAKSRRTRAVEKVTRTSSRPKAMAGQPNDRIAKRVL